MIHLHLVDENYVLHPIKSIFMVFKKESLYALQ